MINVESLEIHVSNHCNLSCRGCSHISPLENEKFIDVDEMVRTLKVLSKVLHCKVIRLLGGEPTLNSNLEYVVGQVANLNIADSISIATNGILLNKITDNILDKIDIMEISSYNYSEKIINKFKTWALENKSKHNIKTYIYLYKYFREPFSYIKNEDIELINKIYKSCIVSQKWQCFNVYEGYFFKCPQAMAICKNIKECNFENNGVKIIDNTNLKSELLTYINSLKPLQACSYCLGTSGKRFNISQVSKKEYIERSSKSCKELLDSKFLHKCLNNDIGDMMTVKKVIEI